MNTTSVGAGGYVDLYCKEIEVPDADQSWIPATTPPVIGKEYMTLNSLTGATAILLKSQSGGWWSGCAMWPELVTHWKPLP